MGGRLLILLKRLSDGAAEQDKDGKVAGWFKRDIEEDKDEG